MSTVISVEQVSKSYRLGQIGGGTLKEDFARWCAKLQGKPDPSLKIGQEHHARLIGQEFWALQDVSFEVKEGEALGIIGRNGAGKSTMLKILSQVTTPTSGQIKIKGRIASLLEVGTGFHPELTGRENVFLNGAILGMTKAEIRKNFDEIVAFSGVEEFIETPVKRYSSGMYVRLAFAVAAHLEPEILIIDEVLAVGDAEFQKKCLEKMKKVARDGRTILFVSHNMAAVVALCSRVVWLSDGKCRMIGNAREIGDAYLSTSAIKSEQKTDLLTFTRHGDAGSWGCIVSLEWLDGFPLRHGCPIRARLEIEFTRPAEDIRVALGFCTAEGVRLITYDSDLNQSGCFSVEKAGRQMFDLHIDTLPLNPGHYSIDVGCKLGEEYGLDYLKGAASIEIVSGPNTPADYFGKEPTARLNGLWKSSSIDNHNNSPTE
jgi:lipopolysaccharide transport system ATP-binding protein